VPIEQIARLVGHSGTAVTETVCRKQIRPVITEGADTMDRIFPAVDRATSGEPSTNGRTDTPRRQGDH
jgi:hypothetical protein